MIRKFLSILLLFVFVYNLLGWYPVFSILRNEARKEAAQRIREGIAHHELIHFQVEGHQRSDLRWVNDHEFVFEGNYYDVISSEEFNEVLYLVCYLDKKETSLVVKFEKEQGNTDQQTASTGNQISHLLKKSLSDIFFIKDFQNNSDSQPQTLLSESISGILEGHNKVFTPPPKQL